MVPKLPEVAMAVDSRMLQETLAEHKKEMLQAISAAVSEAMTDTRRNIDELWEKSTKIFQLQWMT